MLDDTNADPALVAKAFTMPSEVELQQLCDVVDPEVVHRARENVIGAIARALELKIAARREACEDEGPFSVSPEAVGRRSLKNVCLAYLARIAPDAALAQLKSASNMSDRLAALMCVVNHEENVKREPIESFFEIFKDDELVLDKWFGAQAVAARHDTVEHVESLLSHASYDATNPNKIRALVGAFASQNPRAFHRADGAGYRLLGRLVTEIDDFNPQVAARILIPLTRHQKFDDARTKLMRAELEKLVAREGVSRDVYEIASKGLAA